MHAQSSEVIAAAGRCRTQFVTYMSSRAALLYVAAELPLNTHSLEHHKVALPLVSFSQIAGVKFRRDYLL